MSINEEVFSRALRELADHDPLGTAPAARVISRGRRARRGRTALALTAAAVVVGAAATSALGVGVGGGVGPTGMGENRDGTRPAATATADTPELRLVAAARATAQTSFRFQVHTSDDSLEGSKRMKLERSYDGAFDPHGPKGYVNAHEPGQDQRLIGQDRYVSRHGLGIPPSAWRKVPNDDARGLFVDGGPSGLTGLSSTIDPAAQIDALKQRGTITPVGKSGSGPAAVERYAFTYTWEPHSTDLPTRVPVSGTIEVNAAAGMISKISYGLLADLTSHFVDMVVKDTMVVTWTYSDYGLAVDVPVPPTIEDHK
jgi:hypothetical protein